MTSPECDGSLADDSGGMSPFKLLKKNVGFPGSASGKELPANAGGVRDSVSIPGSGRYPGEGMATHSSILAWRIPQRGAWWATVSRASKSQTGLKQLACTRRM